MVSTKLRRARITAEIVFAAVAQFVIVLVFGSLAVFAVSENNVFGFSAIAAVTGVGLSIGLWKHVDDVIQYVKSDQSYS